jgi:hypothetical protein
VALAAVAESKNNVTPPPWPLPPPPLFVIELLPAFDVSKNAVVPPTKAEIELPLLVKVEWSAVEEPRNCTTPPCPPLGAGPAVTAVAFPAVALFANVSVPEPPTLSTPIIKFWALDELFTMPLPLIVKTNELLVIVNALAPELKTMLFTVMRLERETPVMLDVANVAVSLGELGTVDGVQFAAVFQSPVRGESFHAALPAKLELTAGRRRISTMDRMTRERASKRGSER